MCDEKRLTKEIAEQFLADEDSVDVSEFKVIEDAAAEILVQYEGDTLELAGVTALSDRAAESLSHYNGWLTLESLTSLPDTKGHTRLAFHLGVMYGDSNSDGRELELNGLDYLSDEAANYFQDIRANLELNSLTNLTDDVALFLSCQIGDLSLNGVTNLSDQAAEWLSLHQGGHLSLNGLTTLSDTAAWWLGGLMGYLGLNGLKTLSDNAVESLSVHKGELGLSGLTKLSVAAAESLGSHEGGIALDGLTSISGTAAKYLSKLKGDLHLDGVTHLSDVAAKNLIECPQCPRFACPNCSYTHKPLQFDRCPRCNVDSYESWDIDGYYVSLTGLKELSDNAARSLSLSNRGLYIESDNLSGSAAKILRRHPDHGYTF